MMSEDRFYRAMHALENMRLSRDALAKENSFLKAEVERLKRENAEYRKMKGSE